MLPRKGAGTGAGKRAEETQAPPVPIVLNGWKFLAWPAFDERWVALLRAVAAQRKFNPQHSPSLPEATLLAALVAVLRDRIARDPNAPNYRLRDNLAAWRRVKFLGRLRLFYRFSSAEHIVVLTWLNDENTLRKQGASTDPYVVFSGMLSRGDVPADWEALVTDGAVIEPEIQRAVDVVFRPPRQIGALAAMVHGTIFSTAMVHASGYLTFIQTHHYAAEAKGLITDTEQREIETTILRDPTAGDLEAGVRKIRIPLAGRGKRGGARVIYYYVERKGKVYLLDIYAKNARASLTQSEKNAVRKLTRLLEEE